MCEASLPPEEEGSFQHLSAAQAGALAAEIGAERLVVTHIVPGRDPEQARAQAARTFAGPLTVAVTGADYRA